MIELELERRIAAPRERVFAAWTEPELLRRWSAPEGMTIADGTTDLRAGGGWSVAMDAPDGTRHEAFGEYREIAAPDRLSFTHAWREPGGASPETLVTVELQPDGADATRLHFTQAGFDSIPRRDGHAGGWSSALDQLQSLLEGHTSLDSEESR